MTIETQEIGFSALLGSFQHMMNLAIEDHLAKRADATALTAACAHALQGGKRFRPALVFLVAEALGHDLNVTSAALAIEFFHTASLVADDLPCMDNDDERREKPSTHKVYGEAIALLAGDALLTLAFQVIAESGSIEAIKEISKAIGTCGTIGGQVADILNKGRDIEYINLKKTAVLFEAAVKSGGIVKGASKREIDTLGNFGRDIGLAFQLLDDLKDKDGYVKLYGACRTKEKAEFLAKRAKSHLKIFGKKAEALLELADLISFPS